MQKVYLAGPITVLTFDGAEDWRAYVKERLENNGNSYFDPSTGTHKFVPGSFKTTGVKALSPLRNQEYLRSAGELTAEAKECLRYQCPLTTARGLTVRDRDDAMKCDVLFVNLLGAKKVSVGTVMEIAWADAVRTPIVVAIEPDGSNVHEHAMINEAIGFRCPTLDEAIRVTRSILAV